MGCSGCFPRRSRAPRPEPGWAGAPVCPFCSHLAAPCPPVLELVLPKAQRDQGRRQPIPKLQCVGHCRHCLCPSGTDPVARTSTAGSSPGLPRQGGFRRSRGRPSDGRPCSHTLHVVPPALGSLGADRSLWSIPCGGAGSWTPPHPSALLSSRNLLPPGLFLFPFFLLENIFFIALEREEGKEKYQFIAFL